MLEWLKQLLVYGMLIIGVIAAVVYIPKLFSKVAVSEGYSDIPGIDQTSDFALDPSVPIAQLSVGDGIAWRLPGPDRDDVGLGWFAAGPGDVVEVDATGRLLVNGTVFEKPGLVHSPPARLVIPELHYFAVTQGHRLDSVKHGPLSQATYRGRVRGLP